MRELVELIFLYIFRYRGLVEMARVSLELILSQVLSEMTSRALASSQSSSILKTARVKRMDTHLIENRVLLRVYNNIVADIKANLYNPCYNFTLNSFSRVNADKYEKPAPYIVVKYRDILGKSGLEFKAFGSIEDFKDYLSSKEAYLNDNQILLFNGYLITEDVLRELGILNSINPNIITKSSPNPNMIDYFHKIHVFYHNPTELSPLSKWGKPFKRSSLSVLI